MFQSTLPHFSEPVNKLTVCTPERHLKHHVNLTINNDNYGDPQLPHQNQMHTANYKSLATNSNRSQQIQIAHSELQITHSTLQIAHSKLQIAHSKFKSLPFCRGSRVFFRVSRVHCRGSLCYTKKCMEVSKENLQ